MNLVYELYNGNKPCTRTTNPLGEPESKKIGFVAPMLKFPSAKISKTINMLCKHGTTNVIVRKKLNWYKNNRSAIIIDL